jgi:hypothetical protein
MMRSGFGGKPTIPTMSGSTDRNRDDERKGRKGGYESGSTKKTYRALRNVGRMMLRVVN